MRSAWGLDCQLCMTTYLWGPRLHALPRSVSLTSLFCGNRFRNVEADMLVVQADTLIASGVSNWGGWALAFAMHVLQKVR